MFRKTILTFALTAMVGMLFAQSLQFELDGTVYANNDIVVCTAEPTEWGEMVMEMSLRNLTHETIPVIVEKEHVQIVEGTENSFCWGLCFGPDTFVSRPAVDLGGDSISGAGMLSFHYQADPTYTGTACIPGTTVVKYYAYPETNPDDKVCLEVWFAYNAESVEEHSFTIGEAYPNPASNTVNFNVNHAGMLKAVVYNLLGQEVKSMTFNNINKVSFPVDDLQSGIYFCSFTADGQVCKTEKFIVKR